MSKNKKKISDSHINQINVLRILSKDNVLTLDAKPLPITEIAELTGLKDERETQRYLFILEGQKLVSPFPEGDFTSKSWAITRHGIKTLKTISNSMQ